MVLEKVTSSFNSSLGFVQYFAETCLPDVEMQFFRGSDLLESTTETVEKGYRGTLQLHPGDLKTGELVCQARSEVGNTVVRDAFSFQSG